MIRTARIATAATLAMLTITAPAGSALAATPPQAVQGVLPKPTGPHEAGEDVLHLVDRSRPDPWLPSAGPRQLMVSMFYPAWQGTGSPAAYMTPGEAQGFVRWRVPPGAPITPDDLTVTRTYAFTDARPAPGRFPLIVLSPGLGLPRATLTSLATEFASHDYVVALIGHTYEDSGETFPDGTTSPCLTCGEGGPGGPPPATPDQIAASRALDVSFVLDQLTRDHAWRLAHLIDKDEVGMAGHSVGGAATAVTMLDDARIRAGVNMDGTFFPPVPPTGIGHRPFLMVEHPGGAPDPTWTQSWADLDGFKRWLSLAGANHASFTDLAVLAEEFGIPLPGSLDGLRGIAVTRAYVTAFFDQALKAKCAPLLDGPSAAYPEVGFLP